MSQEDVLTEIQRHRSFNEAKIEALRREITTLEQETDELAIAERVVRRLSPSTSAREPDSVAPSAGSGRDELEASNDKVGSQADEPLTDQPQADQPQTDRPLADAPPTDAVEASPLGGGDAAAGAFHVNGGDQGFTHGS